MTWKRVTVQDILNNFLIIVMFGKTHRPTCHEVSLNLRILQTYVYIILGFLCLNFNSPKIATALSKALYKAQKFGAQ